MIIAVPIESIIGFTIEKISTVVGLRARKQTLRLFVAIIDYYASAEMLHVMIFRVHGTEDANVSDRACEWLYRKQCALSSRTLHARRHVGRHSEKE